MTTSVFSAEATNSIQQIDLPTTLRLAGAQNLDIKIARERLTEAKANSAATLAQFLPWISPSLTYRRHDDKLQDVQGNIIDVNKYSYAPGAALGAQVDLGDTYYKNLVAKQLLKAAEQGLESQRQDSVLAAVEAYFELAVAQAAVAIAGQSLKINADYETQLAQALEAGLAFKGDLLRVSVQKQRSQSVLRQSMEQQRIAAARLAQILHLDPTVDLAAQDSEMLPLMLVATNTALSSVVEESLLHRAELKQSAALLSAAKSNSEGARFGPLIPTIGGQAFFGGLGGGRDGVSDSFGPQEDYSIGASWRLGPGGLFDFTRTRAADAKTKIAQGTLEKVRDQILREAVEAFTHWQSLADQLDTARSTLVAARQGLSLAQQRKEFAVGIVLETIQAEQDLTRARLDFARTVADFNKAQYALRKVTGSL